MPKISMNGENAKKVKLNITMQKSICKEARNELLRMKTKKIKGTIDIQSVVTLGLNIIEVRNK